MLESFRHISPEELRERNKKLLSDYPENKHRAIDQTVQEWVNVLYLYENYNFFDLDPTHDTNRQFLFIVGMPRAGKSTFEEIISTHPSFESYDELYSLNSFLEELTGPDKKTYKYPDYIPHLAPEIFSGIADDFVSHLNKEILKNYSTLPEDNKIITNTIPNNFLYTPLLAKILPKSKIIWCTREPSHLLFSIYQTKFHDHYWRFTKDIDLLLEAHDIHRQMHDLFKEKMPDSFITLQFEELLESPQKTLSNIFKYLDIPVSDEDVRKMANDNQSLLSEIQLENYYISQQLPYFPEFLDPPIFID